MERLDENLVKEIEKFVFDGWDMGLVGNDLVSYVCAMTRQPSFHVDPVIKSLMNRMVD